MGVHVERGGRGPRVVLVHGFAQTARCWGPLADALGERHEVLRVDAPGHGASPEVPHDAWAAANELVGAAGQGAWLGYSMGGRLALHAAIAHPAAVRALVLVGATAGIDDEAARAERVHADEQLAARLEAEGLDAFLRRWLELPLFAGLPEWARFEAERRRNHPAALAAALRRLGTGAQEPLWGRLAEVRAPTLVLAGEHDERFVAAGQRLAAAITGAELVVVPGVGHAAHLEDPPAVAAVVLRWLDQALAQSPPASSAP